ncbi:succinylglutamate desuccinylase/aspartoacylase family protein [Novacetimonas sp. GS1]|uniref:succinylglutamate desuccinylase/aspartoacylase domain-containing protein n=1 Tax=Novacetimonas sp. GS1 TaxID=3119990 RepID=UPI002FCD0E00
MKHLPPVDAVPIRTRRRGVFMETLPPPPAPLPRFKVEVPPPDLSAWREGNCGIPGVMHFESRRVGPHVVVVCLIHGNEYTGAIVMDELLRARIRPATGRLSVIFANIGALAQFDPERPVASRFIDEDMNRVWSEDTLHGARSSHELNRARQILPVIHTADILMDLHSMLWPGRPLILSGRAARGITLAQQIGATELIVADDGHADGTRLIDFARFSSPHTQARACLLEAGQHWQVQTLHTARRAVRALLRPSCLLTGNIQKTWEVEKTIAETPPTTRMRCMVVTDLVRAQSSRFTFVSPFCGGDIIAQRGTLLARDGDDEIRTPYDDCMLVMPNLRPGRGQTALRLARHVP